MTSKKKGMEPFGGAPVSCLRLGLVAKIKGVIKRAFFNSNYKHGCCVHGG